MVGTFYAHKIGFDKLVALVKKSLPKGKISINEEKGSQVIIIETKGKLFSSGSILKVSYRERINPSYQLSEKEDCPLNENLKGLYGFVNSLPTVNESVKGLFLHKIQTLNSEFSIFHNSKV